MATPFARPAISVIPKTAPGWLSNSGAWTFSGVRSQVEQEKKKIERSNREKKKTARPWHFFFSPPKRAISSLGESQTCKLSGESSGIWCWL